MSNHSLAGRVQVGAAGPPSEWGRFGPPVRSTDDLSPDDLAEMRRCVLVLGGLPETFNTIAGAAETFKEKRYYVYWGIPSWAEFVRLSYGKDQRTINRRLKMSIGVKNAEMLGAEPEKRAHTHDQKKLGPDGRKRVDSLGRMDSPADVRPDEPPIPNAEPVPSDPPPVERDKAGVPIPEKHLEIHQVWQLVAEANVLVNQLEAKLMQIALHPGGAYFEESAPLFSPSKRKDKSLYRVDCQVAQVIRTELKEWAPHTLCPYCIDRDHHARCNECNSRRWVPRQRWRNAGQTQQLKVRRLGNETPSVPAEGD